MFQFTAFASHDLCIQSRMTQKGRVSPFGNRGIKALCQLPHAYRRLSRPSSPIIAKASTRCTYSLDPITSNTFYRIIGLEYRYLRLVESFLTLFNGWSFDQQIQSTQFITVRTGLNQFSHCLIRRYYFKAKLVHSVWLFSRRVKL